MKNIIYAFGVGQISSLTERMQSSCARDCKGRN
eukprot:UN19725